MDMLNKQFPYITASHISKNYKGKQALSDISFMLSCGQVLGLLGHNGAGKSTLINILLGMSRCDGQLDIFGFSPQKNREQIVKRLAYISDVAVLPEWMTVKQLIKYMRGVHICFEHQKISDYLLKTDIKLNSKISSLSKGMKVQLHLALIMATDVNVLILDEPTLGLDLMYRETFYKNLMEWFHDGQRALIIASHEVDEIAHMLTDVLILKDGVSVLQSSLEQLKNQFSLLSVDNVHLEQAKKLKPISCKAGLGEYRMLFENAAHEQLAELGKVSKPTLADIFIAKQQGYSA